MAVRTLRRSNPITVLLLTILAFAFLYVFLAGSGPAKANLAGVRQAASALSPPSLPFRKARSGAGGGSPASSKDATPPVVHYHMNNLTTTPHPIENRETVLILTPLARFYQEYWDNLLRLSYPHELISLGFIIPKSVAGNQATARLQEQIQKTQQGKATQRFASTTILRQDTEDPLSDQSEHERHALKNQKVRRAAMSKARNSLLFTTLGPTTSWVLWLDSDIIETPPSLIQDLASHDKPIIVPNCFQRFTNAETGKKEVRPYDFNSWQDSPTALQLASALAQDEILVEGYKELATYRTLMGYMITDTSAQGIEQSGGAGVEVELDGVGGTALLVKAEVHRDGAMFPPFAFYHLIETEGFAKMARRLGWKSWGLPNYFVYHYNE